MTKPPDDFEAVRRVIEALEPFDAKERERIIRWATEKLGMVAAPPAPGPAAVNLPLRPDVLMHATPKDIKAFVLQKNPRSDNQLAAVVAYYHHFEALPAERKESIGKDDLIDACRKSDRKRPKRPQQVLVNTYHAGLLDKAGAAGQYRLNSVGENLVAMVLPEKQSPHTSAPRKSAVKNNGAKKKVRSRSQ
ncbi:MAG: hypothetical protein CV089_14885 [Nitrospira sp. WS110]|nr:hypothetical protein [Nitrospira sp. WS110]